MIATQPQPITCPRCLATTTRAGEARFCPHCGLPDAARAATTARRVAADGRAYLIADRLAVGSRCDVHRCLFADDHGQERQGVYKLACDARSNDPLAREADVLRHLQASEGADRFGPFLPAVEATFTLDDGRAATVLRLHPEIRTPDELYTLAEVRAAYPAGLDDRNVAWVWRRLLTVLGFAHAANVCHAAIFPPHVLIDPRDHKLLLVDWCASVISNLRFEIPDPSYLPWYRAEASTRRPPTPALDLAFAARCMIHLLGGDPVAGTMPPTADPALQRHLRRCLYGNAKDAGRLLDDFDRLIAALWGPRKFHTFTLPPKRAP